MLGRQRHFCPGPVDVHPDVMHALAGPTLCHREPGFSKVLEALLRDTLAVAEVDPARFAAVAITGSGTAANEAVLAGAVKPGGRVLVPSTGEFGERLAAISKHHHDTVELKQGWGEPMDLARLEQALGEVRPTHLAVVHHETSTGALNPVMEVGSLCRRFGVALIVDMVSSFPADPLDLDAAGVTFATTCSGKALAAYPGIGLVLGKRRAFEALPEGPAGAHYLDLRRHYEFATSRAQTPNTPAVPVFVALARALELLRAEGLPARRRRWNRLAGLVRGHMAAAGLRTLVDEQPRSCVLTAAELPAGMSYEALSSALRERAFVIYGGKGRLEDRIFQVATMGELGEADVDAFFAAFREVTRDSMSEAFVRDRA